MRDNALVLPSNTTINYIIPNEVNYSKAVLNNDIKKYLGERPVDCNVPQSAVNRLLSISKYKTQLKYLPKDYTNYTNII